MPDRRSRQGLAGGRERQYSGALRNAAGHDTNGWQSVIATRVLAAAFCVLAWFSADSAAARDRAPSIVIHAGKADSVNHGLARQFAEAIAVAMNGSLTLDVQESQGSVDNVIEAVKRGGNYVFTASPNTVIDAQRGEKPFTHDRRYGEIRALFPIPAQTVHWVVRRDSGIASLADLAGHSFIPGARGSVSEQVTEAALQMLGIDHQVQLMDIDVAAGAAALKGKQVGGLALSGNYPLPAVLDLAKAVPIRLISLPQAALAKIVAEDDSTAIEIVPKGTYSGVNEDIATLAVPAGVYTTTRMREATAYALTKAFWSQRDALVERTPPWQAVSPGTLGTLKVKLHPGALRYYQEIGVAVPAALR